MTDEQQQKIPYIEYVKFVVHRVLARHRPHEVCDECPYVVCRHCGDFGPQGTDHTCPCPYADDECPDHPRQAAT